MKKYVFLIFAIFAGMAFISCEKENGTTTLVFQQFVQRNDLLSNSEWRIDPNFLGLDKNATAYNLHIESEDDEPWGTFVRFIDEEQFISFDTQSCGNSCFTKVYGKYSLPANDELVISVDSININCSMAGGTNKTETGKGEEIHFKILNFSADGFQLEKIHSDITGASTAENKTISLF
ncbi:MAG: hypothetical protein LBS25_09080 [Candidatus Symbiothrix sp.]|jgi:hypothetical protein|nr:hypothetical protein [Candidatus Symbiothrix sp.]